MSLLVLRERRTLQSVLPWVILAFGILLSAANLLLHDTLFHGRSKAATWSQGAPAAAANKPPAASPTTVTLADGKWKSAGIKTEPAEIVALASEVGVPGRIDANIDHRIEIRPRAAGVIREVHAVLGQKVKKGDLLAVLDSPDIGTARLNLRGRQIELATARTELGWKHQVAENVAKLIPELRKGIPASVIEKTYADRPLGSDRALLLQAYAEFEIAEHEAEKMGTLHREKIVGEHPAFLALHTRESAQAKFEAALEQVRFDAAHEERLAEQKVKLAEAAVIDAAQRLRILGVSADVSRLLAEAAEVAATRPSGHEDVTAYPIVAPFDGTITAKSAVASQKAEMNDVLFMLADLRTVWVMASVHESDFGILRALRGGAIRVTATAYPGETFGARLLSVGTTVDQATRTVPIIAQTDNPDDMLKLGMFVRIVLDTPTRENALTVPIASIVEIDGKNGVFVPSGSDGRTFTFHPVTVGRESAGRRVILAGLSRGETVVAAGAFVLKSELILQADTEED